MRLHAIPFSTNVERVTLALGFKGLDAEIVLHDPADRRGITAVSGQELVPVLEDGDAVLWDSTVILHHLEAAYPTPSLMPRDRARRAEAEIFADWFNRVWKRPPNMIAEGFEEPELAGELRGSLDLFEAMLTGRDHLLGEDFGLADCIAFPFLKYGLIFDPQDEEPFHRVLIDHLALGSNHPQLEAWIRRVDARPRGGHTAGSA